MTDFMVSVTVILLGIVLLCLTAYLVSKYVKMRKIRIRRKWKRSDTEIYYVVSIVLFFAFSLLFIVEGIMGLMY